MESKDRRICITRSVTLLMLMTNLLLMSVAGVGGTTAEPSSAIQTSAPVPTSATYNVKISGTTYSGNTNFPSAQTAYSPVQRFELRGTLVVVPTRDRSGTNFKNGINQRDVGIFVGSPSGSPQAGAMWFATNSAVFYDVGIGNAQQKAAALDVAFVNINQQETLEIEVHGAAARTVQLNTFNVQSGLLANVYQILAGGMELNFQRGGQEVRGSLDFAGSGFIEPSSTRARATITGQRKN